MGKNRFILVSLITSVLLAPFIFFSSSKRSWESSSSLQQSGIIWQELVYPFEFIWHEAARKISRSWQHYIALSEASSENEQLRIQLERLQTRIMDYEEQVQENKRLRKLLGFTKRFQERALAAEVLASYSEAPFQSLRIMRGSRDGIQTGMPVVSAEGIVGRVIRRGLHFSDVQLLTDPDFKLDVLLQRTRVRGVVGGFKRGLCRLQLHRQAEIRIGDTIITSGIVGSFPKGLPVGRVMRISYESDSVAQSITVEPWIDYRRLEEVIVLLNHDREIGKIVETAGAHWLTKAVGPPTGG